MPHLPTGQWDAGVPYPQKTPLRPLTDDERALLQRVARARNQRADRVARARALLAVDAGATFAEAARRLDRRSGDAVAHLIARFNAEGVGALSPRHGGGPPVRYRTAERERILREFGRPPDPEKDGTSVWSLGSLRRALRIAPDGLPMVSTSTILRVLKDAGYSWRADGGWRATDVTQHPSAGQACMEPASRSSGVDECPRSIDPP
ncbi:MAG: helix-turn-helix domain-containing protein [Chloroflexi bacterium]|nr:helix-turn-helix domain-containing protein [Chloroflexota bacterium]